MAQPLSFHWLIEFRKFMKLLANPLLMVLLPLIVNKSAVDLSAISSVKILAKRLNADDISYRHDRTLLAKAIDELIGELDYK